MDRQLLEENILALAWVWKVAPRPFWEFSEYLRMCREGCEGFKEAHIFLLYSGTFGSEL